MVSFNSTEIAFKIKSGKELNKAHFLFKAISNRTLVKIGGALSNFAIGIRFPIKWIVKPTIYSHFCGGETIEDCLPTVTKLSKYNVRSVLDYSVEGKEKPEEIEAALNETLQTIENAAGNEHIPFAVFKPTAFGSDTALEKKSAGEELTEEEEKDARDFVSRIGKLCSRAAELQVPIMIDAEDFKYQKFIDEVVNEMMAKYNKKKAIVFNKYQMYRTDRLDIFRKDLENARAVNYFMGIKFVRGAYMER